MPLDNCKYGDIVSYNLNNTKDSYISIVISTIEEISVLDIASTDPSYSVPQTYTFSGRYTRPTDIKVLGNIDILKLIKDQFPEVFL